MVFVMKWFACSSLLAAQWAYGFFYELVHPLINDHFGFSHLNGCKKHSSTFLFPFCSLFFFSCVCVCVVFLIWLVGYVIVVAYEQRLYFREQNKHSSANASDTSDASEPNRSALRFCRPSKKAWQITSRSPFCSCNFSIAWTLFSESWSSPPPWHRCRERWWMIRAQRFTSSFFVSSDRCWLCGKGTDTESRLVWKDKPGIKLKRLRICNNKLCLN